jgi:hypothetical protein
MRRTGERVTQYAMSREHLAAPTRGSARKNGDQKNEADHARSA